MTKDVSVRRLSRPWYRPSLTTQIIIGLIVGVAVGWIRPEWGNNVYFLRDIFLNLIKSIIGPLVFSTLVVGIAGGGDLRKVGRMGVKALVYFEVVTTAALFIGLAVVNLTKPGTGVPLVTEASETIQKIGETHPQTLIETLVHVCPSSVVDSLLRPRAANQPCPERWRRWNVLACRNASSVSLCRLVILLISTVR